MKRFEAYELLKEYAFAPIFVSKIGMCSPQAIGMTLEEAIENFDKWLKEDGFNTTKYLEYLFICVPSYIVGADKISEALRLFNLGCGRHLLNKEGMFT